jgi:hypothetical protein
VPSGQKTFSNKVTFAKRRWHSWSCLSHPSQSRDNIFSFHLSMTRRHKLLILYDLTIDSPSLDELIRGTLNPLKKRILSLSTVNK